MGYAGYECGCGPGYPGNVGYRPGYGAGFALLIVLFILLIIIGAGFFGKDRYDDGC